MKTGEVTVLFHGTGTRWAGEVADPDHPAHDLYEEVSGRSVRAVPAPFDDQSVCR